MPLVKGTCSNCIKHCTFFYICTNLGKRIIQIAQAWPKKPPISFQALLDLQETLAKPIKSYFKFSFSKRRKCSRKVQKACDLWKDLHYTLYAETLLLFKRWKVCPACKINAPPMFPTAKGSLRLCLGGWEDKLHCQVATGKIWETLQSLLAHLSPHFHLYKLSPCLGNVMLWRKDNKFYPCLKRPCIFKLGWNKDRYSPKPFQKCINNPNGCTSNINALMLIFLCYTWGSSTSNYTREESGPLNQAFTISAPDKLLHLHQQISVAQLTTSSWQLPHWGTSASSASWILPFLFAV